MEKINRKKPLVFLDVSIDGGPAERMIFELFTDVAPKTAENFRALCTGEKGVSTKTAKPLHYKGTFFHLIVKGHVAQAGDFLRQGGKFGENTYGGKFPDFMYGCYLETPTVRQVVKKFYGQVVADFDLIILRWRLNTNDIGTIVFSNDESPKLKHDGPGLLTMAIDDRDECGSLFYVTFKADHRLDRKCVVFGELVNGLKVLKEIENAGDEEGTPSVTVKIINSGELHNDKKKGNRSKMGKNTIQGNNSDKRKGKNKKSLKKRRKRRKVYTSVSDSSTDTDTESSESDSDSDSYATSLSDTSSSSDDRRRKRKRSKRDRNKHGKRKDKRREKRRKRRYRKTKRKSKRNNMSDSESASKSESSYEDNLVIGTLDGKRQSSGNQSPYVQEREISTVNHKKGVAADTSESEEGEFPKENGNHKSNGIGPLMESDQSPDCEPDPVDNRSSKSRSQNLTPRRTMSKSMSISPRKNAYRIPSVSGSPHQIFNKSRSNSPDRSESSRSPIRSPPRIRKGISGSMSSPVRSPSHRSRSRSRTVSPPRRRVAQSSPRTSSRRSSHRSLSRSPKRSLHRSHSRGCGKAPPRRSPTQSPVRAPDRITRRSYSKSPVGAGRRARSPISDRGRSSSRSRSVDHGSPKRIRRGRGFSDRYSYVRRYRSRSPDRSPIRSYRYGGRSYRDGYRRSPRRYRSSPRGRTPPRYRGRRSRSRSPSVSRRRNSPSRSPVRSNSPVERYRGGPARGEKPKSPSRSRSKSRSSPDSRSPRRADKLRSLSGSPTRKTGLVSYEVGDGSPNSDRE